MIKCLSVAALISCAFLHASTVQDWPQWRGPNRNGVANSRVPLVNQLPTQPVLLWETKALEGKSNTHASPVIADGRVFVHTAGETETISDGKKVKVLQRVLLALTLDQGKELWRHSTTGGKSNNTPCVHEGKVLYMDGVGNLICLDTATGKLLWSVAIGKREGTNASPLVLKELAILPVGKDLVGVSLVDGAQRWKVTIDTFANSPVVWTHQDKSYILFGNRQIHCLEPESGRTLWTMAGTTIDKDPSTPAVHGDLMATLFEGGGLRVHRLSLAGAEEVLVADGFVPNKGGAHQATSPAFDGRRIYGIDGEKTFAYDLESKQMAWKGPKADTHSSPLLVDGKLIVSNKSGAMMFDAVSGAALGSNNMVVAYCSSYAFFEGRLVANAGDKVRCYDLRMR